jgi:chromosome segregation ATPase
VDAQSGDLAAVLCDFTREVALRQHKDSVALETAQSQCRSELRRFQDALEASNRTSHELEVKYSDSARAHNETSRAHAECVERLHSANEQLRQQLDEIGELQRRVEEKNGELDAAYDALKAAEGALDHVGAAGADAVQRRLWDIHGRLVKAEADCQRWRKAALERGARDFGAEEAEALSRAVSPRPSPSASGGGGTDLRSQVSFVQTELQRLKRECALLK